jgi:amidohydrolase
MLEDNMNDLHRLVQKHENQIIALRRDLHQIPETAYTEKKTSAYVADFLRGLGLEVRDGIATYGVVGQLRTGRPGPTVMIRADMDALPLQEKTGLAFASRHDGVMHACGHDAHMAMALGAATVLAGLKDTIAGTLKFIFQPAEEGPGGAKPMIDAGVMENPAVDFAIGCHIWPEIEEGRIGVRDDCFMAAMNRFDIEIIGKGGHGAMPHVCVDALEVGTQVVNALQRVASRQMDPLEPVVVTVGTFKAGTAFNIIPATAHLSGTARTFNEEIWRTWHDRLDRIIGGVCASMGATYRLETEEGYPPTINDEGVSAVVRRCAAEVVGKENVVEPEMTLGGEDMSFFLQRARGCYYVLGVGKKNAPSVHTPEFDFDERVLASGVETHCRAAMALLKQKG